MASSFSLALQQRAAAEIVSQAMPRRALFTRLLLVSEITSALLMVQTSQLIHEFAIAIPIIIIPFLVGTMYRLCTCSEECHQEGMKRLGCNPRVIFTSTLTATGYSNFGLGHRQYAGAWAFRTIFLSRLVCVCLLTLVFQKNCSSLEYLNALDCKDASMHNLCESAGSVNGVNPTVETLCAMDHVPKMLHDGCLEGKMDPVSLYVCHDDSTLRALCDGQVVVCTLDTSADEFKPETALVLLYFFTPFCAFLLLMALHIASYIVCGEWLVSVKEKPRLRQQIQEWAKRFEQELENGELLRSIWWDRRSLEMKLAFFILDIVADIVCLFQYYYLEEFVFGCCQLAILVVSTIYQLWGARVAAEQVSLSWKEGMACNGLQKALLKEKTFEAPLSLLLQFYSAFFARGNINAFLIFGFSMALSIFGITNGFYITRHLAVVDYDAEEKEEVLKTSRPPAAVHGGVLPPTTPTGLPPPPGLSPSVLPPPPGLSPSVLPPPPGLPPRANAFASPIPSGLIFPQARPKVARKPGQFVSDTE